MPNDCYCPPPLTNWESLHARRESEEYLGSEEEMSESWEVSGAYGSRGFAEWETAEEAIEDRFFRLAQKWDMETATMSSTTDIISHPSYQEIISLGWSIVPLLLSDLKENQRFWFPALHEITKIRPFDPTDAGNSKRMVKAWLAWGTRKGLI
jgi:hypothetical protein